MSDFETPDHHPIATVILFRTPTSDNDPYEAAFSSAGYYASSIQTLSETYEISELRRILQHVGEGWENVVISSRRGAEAWVKAAQANSEYSDSRGRGDWSSTPLFTVGQSSIETFDTPRIPSNLLPFISPEHTAKTAALLLPLLLASPPRNGEVHKSTFVLRGDKSMDEIPSGLRRAGRTVQEVSVYSTSKAPGLGVRIQEVLGGLKRAEGGVIWLAFFSPSSAGYTIPYLREMEFISAERNPTRIAAIGTTTGKYLEEMGISVDAIAEEPTPGGLLHAIQGYKG